MPSEGKIEFYSGNDTPISEVFPLLSIAAPYLDTIEEMTGQEFFRFHSGFKPLFSGMSIQQILDRVGLENAADKQIRYYSSGMKQRIKLAQAFFSDTPVLLLDEPTTNLDADGIRVYHELIQEFTRERLLIVSSNDPLEYSFCNNIINMSTLKVTM